MLPNALCTPSMSLESLSAKYSLYATPSKSGFSLSQYATMKVDLKQRWPSLFPALLYSVSSTSARGQSLAKIIFKYLLYAIVLANLRGAPVVWHWRVFWPIIKYNLQFLAFRVPNACATLLNRGERARRIAGYIDKTSPVGVHPFDFEVIYRSRVSLYHPPFLYWHEADPIACISQISGVDESDFNMHMSNSSYPKVHLGILHCYHISIMYSQLRK